jgi:endonuclease-3 related protein
MKTKIYQPRVMGLYLSFAKKYGSPKEFWKKWCKNQKTKQDREEIALGAILTQRTNWRNVEKALKNLKEARALSIEKIYKIRKRDIKLLEKLIKPSGFYKQKAKRIYQFCEFIAKNHGSLEKFFNQDLETCREQLLKISGIGPETADSILLYAGNKPIFVIDEYTRRLVKKRKITNKLSYDHLQQLFQQNLAKNTKIYQDFHAMIVLEGRGTDWDLETPIKQKRLFL